MRDAQWLLPVFTFFGPVILVCGIPFIILRGVYAIKLRGEDFRLVETVGSIF